VSLPPGVAVKSPKPVESARSGFTRLEFSINDLAKDAVSAVKIEFALNGKPADGKKVLRVAAIATVTSRVFNPNPVNNSNFELTTFGEEK
jgi:hypothetical protein